MPGSSQGVCFEVIQRRVSSLELNSPLLRDTLGLGICQGSFGTEPADQGEAAVREGAGLCPTSVTSTV